MTTMKLSLFHRGTKSVHNLLRSVASFVLTARALFSGVCHAAKNGRLLPRLTLILLFHAAAHLYVFAPAARDAGGRTSPGRWRTCSLCVLNANVALNAVGYTVLVLLYRHSVRTIFNREVPAPRRDAGGGPAPHPAVPSFNAHLLMLRPLEVAFRLLSAPLRVLPDVLVLGETRCGTTHLCARLASLGAGQGKLKCHTSFCPWAHPMLDHKETFYFVGHYLGIVDPYFYRMAFPLKITRWWEETVLGNIFFCFDGCAQYLSHPTVPYLIATAYQGCEAPPVLVACVRNPVDQAISWWKYENNAMAWGESMGLTEWNTGLRTDQYPPETLAKALEYSRSDLVKNLYSNAEKLGEAFQHRGKRSGSNPKRSLSKLLAGDIERLPSWAITWPAGQLSAIGRSGRYFDNIARYERVFAAAFGGHQSDAPDAVNFGEGNCNRRIAAGEARCSSAENEIGRVHVIPLESQSDDRALDSALRPVLEQCVRRRKTLPLHERPGVVEAIAQHASTLASSGSNEGTKALRNSSVALSNPEKEPGPKDIALLQKYFEKETAWYFSNVRQS